MHMTLHSIRTVGAVFRGAPDANTMPVIFDSFCIVFILYIQSIVVIVIVDSAST